MAEEIRTWKRWPLRHRVAAAVLAALPMLAVGGALLPNVVEVSALRSSITEPPRPVVQPVRGDDEILVPRSFWTEVVPELNELASLFVDAKAVSQTIAKVRNISGMLATERELLLLPEESLFANSLDTAVVSATPPVGAPGQMPVALENICGLDGSPHLSCYDDKFALELAEMKVSAGGDLYVGAGQPAPRTVTVVPEPSTGMLLSLGLVWMVARRRR